MGCSKVNAQPNFFLDSKIAMDNGTYAYFGMQPNVYMGVTVEGTARMDYKSERKRLVPTLSYPGLAIKGIVAVGPTFDIYGQIHGVVQLNGTMSAGAKYTFEKSEVYWPQGDDSADHSEIKDLVKDPEPVKSSIEPSFHVNVRASADLDINATPEANIGIMMVGFVNTTLRFHADATADASTDPSEASAGYTYNYGIYLLYNLGYGSTPTSSSTKRSLPSNEDSPVHEGSDVEVTAPINRLNVARVIGFDIIRNLLWGSAPELGNSTSQTMWKRDDGDDSDTDMMDVDDDDDSASFSPQNSLTYPANYCAAPGGNNPNNHPANVNVTGDANWQTWSSGGDDENTAWLSLKNDWQSLAHYDSYIPQAYGITKAQYDKGHGGYNHQRNFTLTLADPSGPADGAVWGIQPLSSYFGPLVPSGTDATQVACAVNLFGANQPL
ncbi:hypothetical protein BDW72DRAFT_198485 [Aspergillus terricola var. indicus]